MVNFLNEQIINTVKNTFTKLRQDLGRDVQVIITGSASLRNCPNCLFDSINNESTGKYLPESPYPSGYFSGPTSFIGICPICKGKGLAYPNNVEDYITTISSVTITDYNFVRRNNGFIDDKAGNYNDIDLILGMDLNTSVLSSGVTTVTGGRTLFDEASYVVVDGEKYEVKYTSKSGLGELFTLRVYVHRIT